MRAILGLHLLKMWADPLRRIGRTKCNEIFLGRKALSQNGKENYHLSQHGCGYIRVSILYKCYASKSAPGLASNRPEKIKLSPNRNYFRRWIVRSASILSQVVFVAVDFASHMNPNKLNLIFPPRRKIQHFKSIMWLCPINVG